MAASTFEFIRLQICALIFSFVSESFAGDAFKIVESFRERKICLPFPITTKDHWNIVYLSLRANKKKRRRQMNGNVICVQEQRTYTHTTQKILV